MAFHRLQNHFESFRLPEPARQAVSARGFLWYPAGWFGALTLEQSVAQQCIYREAFERAQAVVRPSLPERDLLAVWN